MAGCTQALGAQTPIDDLCFVELEAVIFRWLEAWRLAHRALDVVHDTALAADHVMVVVADAQLVERGRARGLDATHDAGLPAHAEHVVDRLRRHAPELGAHLADDEVRGCMWVFREHLEHSHARRGDPKAGCPQQVGRRLRMSFTRAHSSGKRVAR